jgi:hypothetical protein
MCQEEPSDWQLAVKWRNGSLALEIFPASGHLGENTTTRWYKVPRYKNVVFELTEAQFSVEEGKPRSKERWHLAKFLHLAENKFGSKKS